MAVKPFDRKRKKKTTQKRKPHSTCFEILSYFGIVGKEYFNTLLNRCRRVMDVYGKSNNSPKNQTIRCLFPLNLKI